MSISCYKGYSETFKKYNYCKYEIYECFEYKVKVCRLSAELYHCFKALYIADNSDAPIHLGFSPVTYTYTNVEGGLGIFGAMSVYESDWRYYEN